MDLWIDGSLNRWISRSVDLWIDRSVDGWIARSMDLWIGGSLDRWVVGWTFTAGWTLVAKYLKTDLKVIYWLIWKYLKHDDRCLFFTKDNFVFSQYRISLVMDRPHFQNKGHKAYDIFMEKKTRFQPCYEYVFLGLRNNFTYSRCFQNSTQLPVLNILFGDWSFWIAFFWKVRCSTIQIFRSFWPDSSQLEYGPKRRHIVLRIQKNTACAMFQKCLSKLWGTFYLMKHRRRCQQIGFARCNFNWIQEFGTSFSLFPTCFVLAPSTYESI